ncbi:unnamed protein product [Prorocentrum cordatum]|uniref:Peptidase A1 domain-containing protein n=1 Tax=Prorocentrum cordatum TaxID=2364126 RepID=A0ABN9XDZ4_9DINO|nr:unnamed protein product [Polarella glacialis]
MGPPDQVARLLDAIGSNSTPLPSLSFRFAAAAGSTFDAELRPEDYCQGVGKVCVVGIQPMQLPAAVGPMWVLGQTALRRYYSVYDAQRWRVGLGLAKHAAARRSPAAPAEAAETGAEACEDCKIKHNRACRLGPTASPKGERTSGVAS